MEDLGRKFRLITLFTAIGVLMQVGFLIIRVLNPDADQFTFHKAVAPSEVTTILSAADNAMYTGLSLTLDLFFIAAFTALFYGFYLYLKDYDEFFAKLAFTTGLLTALFDLLEDGMILVLATGIPHGYTPDNLLLGIMWTVTAVKDIFSYVTTFIFGILFLMSWQQPPELKWNKLLFAVLILFYAFIGSLSFGFPTLLLIRNLGFVFQFLIAAFLFYKTPVEAFGKTP